MKQCINCNSEIKKYGKKFCSRSCAAIVNNHLFPKRSANQNKICLFCNDDLKEGKKYCSLKCQQDYHQRVWVNEWLNGERPGGRVTPSSRIKRYLKNKQNNCCSICRFDKWNGKPIGLILDHINGNPLDHSPDNVRLVCGNCDMQLPTYKGLNKGKGRAYRRERYHDGKSY